MKLAVIGLGLIGGSVARAAKAFNEKSQTETYQVLGLDRDEDSLALALEEGAVDRPCKDLGEAYLTVLALPPDAVREFLAKHAGEFRADGIVIDVCGVKSSLCDFVRSLPGRKFTFFGCHPMAGREVSGFSASLATLFHRASFVVTRTGGLGQTELQLEELRQFAVDLGFERTVVCDPETHDRAIAYTSQLCHVVSSAYVKSPTLPLREGFTAGSFRDLSRVAYLDERLWCSLFLENREHLSSEIGNLVDRLLEFKSAIDGEDGERLIRLLADGRMLAEEIRNKK